MAKVKKVYVEFEEAPLFDFGACVVACLLLGACAFGLYAAVFL